MSADKDDPTEELKDQLEEWNMGLDELQSRIERAEAEKQSRLNERAKELRSDYEAAQKRFSSLGEGTPEEWDEFREGMKEGRRLLDEALEESGGSSGSDG